MDKFSKGSYESYMEVIKRSVDETKKRIVNLPKSEWVARLSYEQWVEYEKGNLKLFSPLNVDDIRNSRMFNYNFGKGEIVKLDVEVTNDIE